MYIRKTKRTVTLKLCVDAFPAAVRHPGDWNNSHKPSDRGPVCYLGRLQPVMGTSSRKKSLGNITLVMLSYSSDVHGIFFMGYLESRVHGNDAINMMSYIPVISHYDPNNIYICIYIYLHIHYIPRVNGQFRKLMIAILPSGNHLGKIITIMKSPGHLGWLSWWFWRRDKIACLEKLLCIPSGYD